MRKQNTFTRKMRIHPWRKQSAFTRKMVKMKPKRTRVFNLPVRKLLERQALERKMSRIEILENEN